MKKIALLICSLIVPLHVFASAASYSEDYLVVDGEGYFIRADPLYSYLSRFCEKDRLQDYVDNFCIPNGPNYTRYWEIKDGWVYLVKIESDKGEKYPLDLIFPDCDGPSIKAFWFSGNLSYRLDDSPVIQLNRAYYEKEAVIRVLKGEVVRRFVINHKERWISYAKRIMNKHHPLADENLEFPVASSGSNGRMAKFLADVFSVATNPKDGPYIYYPTIEIKFNADLDGLQLTKAHRKLSGYDLLEAIVEEAGADLDVIISGRKVIYVIKEGDPAGNRASAHSAEHAADKTSSEGAAF